MRRIMLFLVATVIATTVPASAQAASTCEKAYTVRMAVVKKFGKRAPGRNVCRYGVKHSNGKVTPAKHSQKKRYLFALRRLNTPPVTRYVKTVAVPPRQAPAGTMSQATRYSGGGNYSIPASIVHCESGGSYSAVNPSSGAYGAYQILPSTAAAHGCDLSTPGGQDRCAAVIWATEGRGAWAC